jgi:transcriptional regulator with XRE-family HTH domain
MKFKTYSKKTRQEGGIASELRKCRFQLGLDQAQVAQAIAKKLHVPKLSATWWAQIENGIRPIPLSKLLGVAKVLHPDDPRDFLWAALLEYYGELAEHLEPWPALDKVIGLHLSWPDAERVKKLYRLPAKTRAAIFELIDSIAIPQESTSE